MKKTQSWLKVSKQQSCLDKISETGNQNHLLETIELVTDESLSIAFSRRVTRGGMGERLGRSPLLFFENWKKVP